MDNIAFMRGEIGKVYTGWRNKLRYMPPNQIMAIYHRMRETGQIEYAAERREREANEAKYHQMTIFEYLGEQNGRERL